MTSASTTRHPMRALRTLALLGILAAGSVGIGRAAVDSTAQAAPPAAAREQVLDAYAKLPLTFVENQGQTDPRVVYHAQGPRHAFFLTRGEIVFAFAKTPDGSTDMRNPTTGARGPGVHSMATAATPDAATHRGSLALRFVGSDPRVTVAGQDRAPGEVNHFRGSDPARWHTRLPGYAQVIYRELWPGVDLVLRGHPGELKYEFRVRPGARPADIRLAYAGAVTPFAAEVVRTPLPSRSSMIGVALNNASICGAVITAMSAPSNAETCVIDIAAMSAVCSATIWSVVNATIWSVVSAAAWVVDSATI